MKKIFCLLVLMIFISSLFTGCKKDKGQPPSLPPEQSMTVDFTNFDVGMGSKGIEDSHWSFVHDIAYFWYHDVLVGVLAVPVAAFNYALDQNPSYIEEKTWQWSFEVSVLSVSYKARLVGQIRSTDVLWKMYISKTGTNAFAEFIWFEGTSKLDGTGGQWVLNYGPGNQTALLQIDWTRTGTTINSVKYTYVGAPPYKNSSIEYGKLTGTYNSYYTIKYYYGASIVDVNVEWHSTSKIGRIKSQAFFSDTNWHCWDENHINKTCP